MGRSKAVPVLNALGLPLKIGLKHIRGSMLESLFCLLEQIKKDAPGNVFTGTGIVIYEFLDNFPLLYLGESSEVQGEVDILSSLLETSVATNPNHDGFNMIDADMRLTHRNVYFSPPIDNRVSFDVTKGYGTRYAAAIMASLVEGIKYTAVVSNSYGIVVFETGKEIKRINS